jgi:hypothetical protein
MKLLAKFNLILLVVFGAGGILICELAYSFLISNARREVLAQGDLMMTSNGATLPKISSRCWSRIRGTR